MPFIIFERETGKPVIKHHMVDVKEAIETGQYVLDPARRDVQKDMVDYRLVRKAPEPVAPEEKKKAERRPEDNIVYKDAKTIGASPKSR